MTIFIQPFFDRSTSTFSYVVDDGAGQGAVVDPVLGFDMASGRTDAAPADAVATFVKARGLCVRWLLETHAHADHLSAGPCLRQRFGGKLAIGAGIADVQRVFGDIFHLENLSHVDAEFDHLFANGDTFSIGLLTATAMAVPGHTPADMAYRIDDPDGGPSVVFVGDTLFMPDVGTARCDFPGGDAGLLYRSIRTLLALPGDTLLYVCHDYPPNGREPACRASVAIQRSENIHVRDGIDEAAFVAMRQARDKTLAMPALMLPSVQVNIRAGHLPPPDENGTSYLRIPLNRF